MKIKPPGLLNHVESLLATSRGVMDIPGYQFSSHVHKNMRIFGVDFTSTPSCRKPICVAEGILQDDRLTIAGLHRQDSWSKFESWLHTEGPWISGFDFPLSQPRPLIEKKDWPTTWPALVNLITSKSKAEWLATLENFCSGQPAGHKHLFRVADKIAGACSPMMRFGVPVARMFYEGSSRLAETNISIIPCRPSLDSRTAIEVYPSLLVRGLGLGSSYKKSGKLGGNSPDAKEKRLQIWRAIHSPWLKTNYDLRLKTAITANIFLDDPQGDCLDALICAIQAGWSWRQKEPRLGIPSIADSLEGWIVDPATLPSRL